MKIKYNNIEYNELTFNTGNGLTFLYNIYYYISFKSYLLIYK